jgi:hypothetical protein
MPTGGPRALPSHPLSIAMERGQGVRLPKKCQGKSLYLVMRGDTLLLRLEEQSICAWGIAGKALEEDDPPVALALPGSFGWEGQTSDWIRVMFISPASSI